MKSIQFIVCFLSLICFNSQLSAQLGNGKSSDIKEILQRPLIVIIEEPDSKVIKKLDKKGLEAEKKDYLEDIAQYNANMKAMVEKYWKGSGKKIIYKTEKQLPDIRVKNREGYALLYCVSYTMKTITVRGSQSYYPSYTDNLFSGYDFRELGKKWPHRSEHSIMIINLLENGYFAPIYSVTLPNLIPTQFDLRLGMDMLRNYFDYQLYKEKNKSKISLRNYEKATIEQNAAKLKDMTLLIPEYYLYEDFTKEDLKKIYPYPFKLCSTEEYKKLIMQEDEKYAYMTDCSIPVSTNGCITNYSILTAKDNTILAGDLSNPGSLFDPKKFMAMTHGKIDEKIMKKFAEQISGEEEDKDKKQKK